MSGIITHISAIESCFKRGDISYYIEPEDGESLAKLHRKLARAEWMARCASSRER